jgi:APA family basic amino acid/polyamine antiporter
MSLFRKKQIIQSNSHLKQSLGAFDLITLGVGAIIGTGIFVLTGIQAATNAGPALIISFIIAGIACAFAALCYSEFASTISEAGSAYTYTYVTFGEIFAWILGWDLVLEYGVASSAVASGWSGYFQGLLSQVNIHLPNALTGAFDPSAGTIVNLPAILIVFLVTLLLSRGVKESVRWNTIMVFVKIAVVLLFIIVGVFYVEPSNWTPFMPYHFSGVTAAAAVVVFAYFGFDAVSTAAEEVKDPQRNVPIGIISSLAICTVLYIIVTLVLTGMVPYKLLNVPDAVAFALRYVNQGWAAYFISLGAIFGITTVLIVMMYGQTRLFYAMSRDGLLPKAFANISTKTQVPVKGTWITGALVAFFAGVVSLDKLAELVSIGTLFAFSSVCLGVIVLRKTKPDLKRGFRTPWVPVIPILGMVFCVFLMTQLQKTTWFGFVIWLVIGLIIYFTFGRKHSNLKK